MNFIEERDHHDSLRAHFQTVDVQELNRVLLANGVTGLPLRKKILNDYFFGAGSFLDSGWFEADGKKYAPMICFREVTAELKRGETVVCPDAKWGTIFHEFAGGTAEMVAENPGAEHLQVKTGEIRQASDRTAG